MTGPFTGSFRIDLPVGRRYGTFSSEGVFTLTYSELPGGEIIGNFSIKIDEDGDGDSTTCCYGSFGIIEFLIPGYDYVELNGPFLVDLDGQPYEGYFSFNRYKGRGVFERNNPFAENMERSWREALSTELVKQYFLKLNDVLISQKENVCPELEDIYAWTTACPIAKVNVVILGQDPYPSKTMAHGLAFSMKRGNQPSPSLDRIYEELMLEGLLPTKPNHGYLMSWAEQGVLLLNTWLTVKEGVPGSHSDIGWETFTNAVIKHLSDTKTGIVFILWGKKAKKKASLIHEVSELNPNGHLILCGTHPSPEAKLKAKIDFLSYDKQRSGELVRNKAPQYFRECNAFLKSLYKPEIDWASLLDK